MLWNYLEKILLRLFQSGGKFRRKNRKISKVVADKGVICRIYTITLGNMLLLELCQKGVKKRNLLGIVFK